MSGFLILLEIKIFLSSIRVGFEWNISPKIWEILMVFSGGNSMSFNNGKSTKSKLIKTTSCTLILTRKEVQIMPQLIPVQLLMQ